MIVHSVSDQERLQSAHHGQHCRRFFLYWGVAQRNRGFPQSGSDIPRHPSPLYQFALEGLLLFVLLWIYARKPRGLGQVSGAFLAGYGVFRFIAEYFREPDAFLGLRALGLSQGQWLSVPMVLIGVGLWLWGRNRVAKTS